MAGQQKATGAEIVPFKNYAIAAFDQDMLTEALTANLGANVNLDRDLDRVKVPGSGGLTWTIPDEDGGEKDADALTGIIVAHKDVRNFYLTSFDEDPNSPPSCSAPDGQHGFGVRSTEQQEPSAQACAACPLSQFGSDKNGSQACQQQKLLFVLTEGDMLPLIVKLPPTSLKPVANYLMSLARKGKPHYAVQTSITLERESNSGGIKYSEARFRRAGDLDPDEIALVRFYRDAITPATASVTGDDPQQ